MVGLSVILENYRDLSENHLHQVIRKGSMMKLPYRGCPNSPTTTPSRVFSRNKTMPDHLRPASSSSSSGFLECCFLCKQKLLPGKDIYIYKGEMAFCSEDCRCRQIFADEEETAKEGCTPEYNCSLAATSSPSSTRSDSSRGATEGPRARANAFAY